MFPFRSGLLGAAYLEDRERFLAQCRDVWNNALLAPLSHEQVSLAEERLQHQREATLAGGLTASHVDELAPELQARVKAMLADVYDELSARVRARVRDDLPAPASRAALLECVDALIARHANTVFLEANERGEWGVGLLCGLFF